jgi:hypothetical protein
VTHPLKQDAIQLIIEAQNAANYPVFKGKDYNLTIGGYRSNQLNTVVSDMFDDVMWWLYPLNGTFELHLFEATTDPGKYFLEKPMNKYGTAILKEGFYKHLWGVGKHRGDYEAYCQINPATYWRDADRDDVMETQNLSKGVIGANCHHSYGEPNLVGNRSAGCQVIWRRKDWAKAIELRDKQVAAGLGSKFSYSLHSVDTMPSLAELKRIMLHREYAAAFGVK